MDTNVEVLGLNGTKRELIAWLRNVLVVIADVSPIPKWLRQPLVRFILRLPDWVVDRWTSAATADYVNAFRTCPDLAEKVRTDTGRRIVGDWLEKHRAVPTVRSLRQLVRTVLKLLQAGSLPADAVEIERGIAGLALANCTPLSNAFIERASAILSSSEETDHLLRRYQLLLARGEHQTVKDIDSVLTSGRYGYWLAERLSEAKRWLFGTIEFRIQLGERSQLWDSLWKNIIRGGKDDQKNCSSLG